MKKLSLIFAIFCCLTSWTFAQEEAEKEKLTEKQIFELLGQLFASEGPVKFDKLDMKAEEIEAYVNGFKSGLKTKVNMEEFKKNQQEIFGFIQKRMAEYTEKNPVTFPLDTKIATVDGKETTIKELMKDQKGVLLDFYASWCGPCMKLMPTLKEKATKLKEQKILVAGMNTENLEDAKKVKEEHSIDFTWLVEPEGRPFSQLLNIDSIPRMILIDTTGKVLFNGHPMDEGLQAKLDALK